MIKLLNSIKKLKMILKIKNKNTLKVDSELNETSIHYFRKKAPYQMFD